MEFNNGQQQVIVEVSDAVAAKKSKSQQEKQKPRGCLTGSSKLKRWLKVGVAFVVVNYVLYSFACMVPLKEYSAELMEWIQENKVAGSVVFPLIYWLLTPLCIPSSMFDLIGGSVFGVFYGVLLNTIGKTGGALITFALGKKIGRERVGGYLESNFPMFSVISTILQSESWKPLLLVQLSSLPYAVKSYGLAITDVSTYRFMVSSFVTALPFTILLTQIGYQTQEILSASQSASNSGVGGPEASNSSSAQMTLFAVGIVLTIATMIFFVIYIKKELQRQLLKVNAMEKRDYDSTTVVRYSGDFGDRYDGDLELTVLNHLLPATMLSSPSKNGNVPKHRSSSV